MELFGIAIQQVYLYSLIILAVCMVLFLFFGDVIDGVGEGIPFFNPAVILSFLTFFAAIGFIFESLTSFSSIVIIAFATIISTVLSVLLYFFILLPLKSAEVSMAYTDESLAGQIGKVIVPIPVDGFGEVVIETVNGLISKRAVGFDNEEIEYNQQVLIVEVKEGTVYVRAYEPMFSK
ncbi:NfeD family protein [Viridibacillus arvi]|uniref:NfeD family protein n=1 Tax=Viridibacillus arvi TaxID=263475 RepID=UPI00187B35CF|nr:MULTISPECIES: NfeD family protein [Viridibacillus]QOV13441.1 NfeD family protein [Viridibacillus sp. JNUCC-6]